MPHYSALRARGTRFRKAFVPSPLCAPSRACLASGREYDRAGVPDNFSNDFPINVTTFMTLLRDGGYDVMTSGKDDLTVSVRGQCGQARARVMRRAHCARAVDVSARTAASARVRGLAVLSYLAPGLDGCHILNHLSPSPPESDGAFYQRILPRGSARLLAVGALRRQERRRGQGAARPVRRVLRGEQRGGGWAQHDVLGDLQCVERGARGC